MTVIEAFALNLKDILEDRELTQRELSRRSGVRPETLNNYLLLRNGPSLVIATKIARTLEISLDSLVEGADE